MNLQMTFDRDNRKVAEGLAEFEFYRKAAEDMVPPGHEEYFREAARYRSVAASVAIERRDPDGETALAVLADGGGEEGAAAERDLASLHEAYSFAANIASNTSAPIDLGTVMALHWLAMKGERGIARGAELRTGPSVVVDTSTGEIRYQAARPGDVAALLDHLVASLRDWTDDGIPGPVVAGLAHFGVISVHPFGDGNGRTARLLADLILARADSWAGGMLSVSEVLHGKRDEYYDTLRKVQGAAFRSPIDVTDWLVQHTWWLVAAARRVEAQAVSHAACAERWRSMFGDVLSSRQTLGALYAAYVGPLASSTYARLTGASTTAAHNDLRRMLDIGVLRRQGGGRSTRYALSGDWASGRMPVEAELGAKKLQAGGAAG